MIRHDLRVVDPFAGVQQLYDRCQMRVVVIDTRDHRKPEHDFCTVFRKHMQVFLNQLIADAGKLPVLFRVCRLAVKQKQIDIRRDLHVALRGSLPTGFHAGMDTGLMQALQEAAHKFELLHRLASGERNAAARTIRRRDLVVAQI